MAFHVLVLHPDADFVTATVAAIRRNGHQVTGFTDPIAVLQAIETVTEPPALVTGVRQGVGRLHGVALGLMASRKHPGMPVLFLTDPEDVEHASGVGAAVPASSTPQEVADALQRLLVPRDQG